MRQAPSMTGLRVLEAGVRCGSLSAAARELCVTPAAISDRLRSLKAQGKAALVRHAGGRLVATDVDDTLAQPGRGAQIITQRRRLMRPVRAGQGRGRAGNKALIGDVFDCMQGDDHLGQRVTNFE